MPSEQMKQDLKRADEVAKKLVERLNRRKKVQKQLDEQRQSNKPKAR